MKKIYLCVLIIISIIFSMSVPALSYFEKKDPFISVDGSKVFCFDDGSSLSITAPKVVFSGYDSEKTLHTKTVQIDASFTDSNGEYEWLYTLTCVFSYEYGVSSTCSIASYSQAIYKGNWTFSNGAASASGNRGTGTGLYERKVLFITVQSINVLLTMACDIYGNVTA